MNLAVFIDERIAALELDAASLNIRIDELRRLRASLPAEPAQETPQAAEPKPKKKPKPKPRTEKQQLSYRPILTAGDKLDADARKIAGILAVRPMKFHDITRIAELQGRDVAAALNHEGWFAKDDDGRWELTPKGVEATKGGVK